MNNIEKSYKKLPPFKGWVLQNFPFIEEDFDAITNYQMMCKVIEYLKVIQNNVDYIQDEEITPLYNAFVELKNYVDNYFDNLDIQTEINNKLDDMAESGQLADIIAQYLQVNSVLGFDTKATLKSAENLVDGSIARTLGTDTYNDGKGNYYKIRTLTSGDVIDDDNILALVNYPTLIAEKMPDFRINQIEAEIPIINNTINKIKAPQNFKERKYLLIGDSYATGYQGSGVPTIEGFYTKVVNDLGITAQIIAGNGYGFVGIGGELKWIDLINSTTIDNKDTFTDIIILGGMNDKTTEALLENAMSELFTYLHTNFPNAEIHVGCVGRYSTSSEANINNCRRTEKGYQTYTIKYGNKYIENSYNLLHNINWYIDDTIHPNTIGETQLAFGVEQYIINGEIARLSNIATYDDYQVDTFVPATGVELASTNFYSYITKDRVGLLFNGNFNFPDTIQCNNNGDIVLGKLTNSYVCGSAYQQGINQLIYGYVYSTTQVGGSNFVKVPFRLFNDNNNNLHLRPFTVRDNGNFQNYTINQISFPFGFIKCEADARMC